MRCPCGYLCLLALPLLLGAGAPVEPARKEFLHVTVRADSGSAHRFRVENQGFLVGNRRAATVRRSHAVDDTLQVIGSGTLELVSADSTKPLSVDVWLVSSYVSAPVRYTGQAVKIRRESAMTPYFVTSR